MAATAPRGRDRPPLSELAGKLDVLTAGQVAGVLKRRMVARDQEQPSHSTVVFAWRVLNHVHRSQAQQLMDEARRFGTELATRTGHAKPKEVAALMSACQELALAWMLATYIDRETHRSLLHAWEPLGFVRGRSVGTKLVTEEMMTVGKEEPLSGRRVGTSKPKAPASAKQAVDAAQGPPAAELRAGAKVVCIRQKAATGEWYCTEPERKRAIGGAAGLFATRELAEEHAKSKRWTLVAAPEGIRQSQPTPPAEAVPTQQPKPAASVTAAGVAKSGPAKPRAKAAANGRGQSGPPGSRPMPVPSPVKVVE
jgi:hypothetical protein